MAGTELVALGTVHAAAAPGAATDILGADLTPKTRSLLGIGVILGTTDAVFSITVDNGTTQFEAPLNNGVALVAGRAYAFSWPADPSFSYNFHVDQATTTISHLVVNEIKGGVS